FGITADFQIVRTETEGPTKGTAFGNGRITTRNVIFTLTGEYQVAASAGSELWAGAGARYWNVENTLSLTAGTLPAASGTVKDSWWDPVIGLRGRQAISDRGALVGWAYLGGFGAGSDFTSDLFLGYNHSFTPVTSLTAGWRYLSVDRTDGAFVYDVEQHGPVIGLTFSF
ncbi:hypothetical protein AB9K41_18020, partial [Cribrihabitans sp. XS_ASV171]